jgi:Flp pilus assembly protein TadB
MITSIIGFITGTLFPFAAKWLQNKAETKTQTDNYRLETERMLQLKTASLLSEEQTAKYQAQTSANELAKAGNEIVAAYKPSNGLIALLIDCVRVSYGVISIVVLVWACAQLWRAGTPMLTAQDVQVAFYTILGWYLGERVAKKCWE